MPRLACFVCGRQIYTVAPLESLFAEERRCPRCGAFLNAERRESERRQTIRRENPTHDPGPPRPKPAAKAKATPKAKTTAKTKTTAKARADPEPVERRVADRRMHRRRDATFRRAAQGDSAGWHD